MYQILKAEKLADKIYLMEVEAPRVARSCEPGEFVIVRIDEEGERIPLTICDYDREQGTVTIVFQTVGASTERMALLKEGDTFRDFVGPLGNPSDFVKEDPEELKKKRILYVAGGVGTAPVYPQVKWLKEHGVKVDVIVGSKTKDLLILTKEMEEQAENLYITTDDGSYGRKGMVTEVITELVEKEGRRYDTCVAIGDDHDEIRLSADKEAESADGCQLKPHHGGWDRDVRSLPCDGGRQGEVRLRGRAGVRRPSGQF